MKSALRDLIPDFYLGYSTSTYICKVTIMLKRWLSRYLIKPKICLFKYGHTFPKQCPIFAQTCSTTSITDSQDMTTIMGQRTSNNVYSVIHVHAKVWGIPNILFMKNIHYPPLWMLTLSIGEILIWHHMMQKFDV